MQISLANIYRTEAALVACRLVPANWTDGKSLPGPGVRAVLQTEFSQVAYML